MSERNGNSWQRTSFLTQCFFQHLERTANFSYMAFDKVLGMVQLSLLTNCLYGRFRNTKYPCLWARETELRQ